jgi:hypothetical protein
LNCAAGGFTNFDSAGKISRTPVSDDDEAAPFKLSKVEQALADHAAN